ncbi:MAG: Ig-like domain-containing protein [Candidatus Cryptobacteroides sp.]
MKKTLFAIMALTVAFVGCQGSDPEEPEMPKEIKVTGISLDRTDIEMVEGETTTLTATVTPSNASDKSITWDSSTPGVASVNDNGKVTAIKAGEATITVTTKDGGMTATCKVKVIAVTVPVESVSLDITEAEMTEGEELTLEATILPENATAKTVSWISSDDNIAAVDENGKVSALKPGKATITATAGDKSAECAVTVIKKVVLVQSVAIEPDNAEVTEGESLQLKAVILPEDATDTEVEWASSSPSVVTVNSGGLITGVKSGTAKVEVRMKSNHDIKGSCNVSVTQNSALKGILLNATEMNLEIGKSSTLTVLYNPEYAANKNVRWNSANPSVATVSEGTVTGIAVGETTVTATSEEGGFTAECKVTVTEAEHGTKVYTSVTTSLYIDGVASSTRGGGYIAFDKGDFYYVYGYDFYKNGKVIASKDAYYDISDMKVKDGTIYCCGHNKANGIGYISVITEDGTITDYKIVENVGSLFVNSMVVAPDGNAYAIASYTDSFGAKKNYQFTLTPDGTVSSKCLEGTSGYDSYCGITADSNGNVYCITRTYNGLMLFKNGVLEQALTSSYDYGSCLLICDGTDLYIARADSHNSLTVYKNGSLIYSYGEGGKIHIRDIDIASNGDLYVTGYDTIIDKSFVLKNGNLLYTIPETNANLSTAILEY